MARGRGRGYEETLHILKSFKKKNHNDRYLRIRSFREEINSQNLNPITAHDYAQNWQSDWSDLLLGAGCD